MSNCIEKIKTDDCLQTRDEGYTKCTASRDDGYKSCSQTRDEGYDKCCGWWPCSWGCKAVVWVSNVVCVAWTWISNIVCVASVWVSNIVCLTWKYITKYLCVVVDVISTILNAIVSVIDVVLGIVGGIIGFAADLIFSIPYIGRFIEWAINIVKTAVYGILSIPDLVLTLLGIMPEKKVKLLVVIQKDNTGTPVVSDLNVVYRDVQFLINTFREELNVRVLPANLFIYRSAFASDNYALEDFVKTDDGTSDEQTLDVCCDSCAAGEDLASNGSLFNLLMARLGFFTNGRRLIGYGAPIIAFSVRKYTDGKAGCSLGPLTDYVTVKFNETNNGGTIPINELTPEKSLDAVTDLAHEVGHCCSLLHKTDSNNLMNPAPNRTGQLTIWQKILVRSSRHVTYL